MSRDLSPPFEVIRDVREEATWVPDIQQYEFPVIVLGGVAERRRGWNPVFLRGREFRS